MKKIFTLLIVMVTAIAFSQPVQRNKFTLALPGSAIADSIWTNTTFRGSNVFLSGVVMTNTANVFGGQIQLSGAGILSSSGSNLFTAAGAKLVVGGANNGNALDTLAGSLNWANSITFRGTSGYLGFWDGEQFADASGNVSAGTNGVFYGNGSGLTNIPNTALQQLPVINNQAGVTLGGTFTGTGTSLVTMPTATLLSTTNVTYTFRTNDGADTLVFTNSPNPCHLWLTLSGNYGHLILRYANATNTILHITTPTLASINYLGGTSNNVATNGARQWFDMAGTNWPNARCDSSLIQP